MKGKKEEEKTVRDVPPIGSSLTFPTYVHIRFDTIYVRQPENPKGLVKSPSPFGAPCRDRKTHGLLIIVSS